MCEWWWRALVDLGVNIFNGGRVRWLGGGLGEPVTDFY